MRGRKDEILRGRCWQSRLKWEGDFLDQQLNFELEIMKVKVLILQCNNLNLIQNV